MVRGGGVNSIIIRGSSTIAKVVVSRADGEVRIEVDDESNVEVIYIDDGSDDVIITGSVQTLDVVANDITVVAREAKIESTTITGENCNLIVNKDSEINKVEIAAQNANVSGKGTVKEAKVQEDGSNSKIETPNTKIQVDSKAKDVKGAGGKTIGGGSTATNNSTGTDTTGQTPFIPPYTPPYTPPVTPTYTPVSGVNITGTTTVGQMLTATVNPSSATVSYRWQRAESSDGEYKNIQGATARTYTLTDDDANKYVKVIATGSGSYTGTVSNSTSEPVKQITYTVTFKDWNDTVLDTQTVEKGKDAVAPTVPGREGYVFINWNILFNNVTRDLIVTALYEINKYTLSFDSNSGSLVDSIRNIEHNSTVTLPANPTKEGLHFAGWFVDNNVFNIAFTESTVVTSNLTVYAKWVTELIPIAGVSLNKKVTAILPGATEQLTATALPANADNKAVTWRSDDDSIASVDSEGLVTGHSVGKTTITATTVDGNKIAQCTIVVYTNSVEKDFEFDAYNKLITGYKGNGGNVTIPSIINEVEVFKIAESVFADNDTIVSVTIPNTVTEIQANAFKNCVNLVSVNHQVGSFLEKIGDYAFFGCINLASFDIPKKVREIGKSIFGDCRSLLEIAVSETNADYSSIDGVLYSKDGSTILTYPAGITAASFTISDSVTSIGEGAFWYCRNLKELLTSENNASYRSVDGILYNKNNTSLVVYPGGRTETSYTVPRNITQIGRGAFGYAYNLLNIYVEEGSLSFSSIDGVLYSKDGKTLIAYPTGRPDAAFSIPLNTRTIGEGAFMASVNLTDIDFQTSPQGRRASIMCSLRGMNPESPVIESYAFYECSNLVNISIPSSIVSIGDYAFANCANLTSVTFSESSNLSHIGIGAFSGCPKLYSFVIPNSVTSIGNDLFSCSTGLTNVTFQEDSQLTYISDAMFSCCFSLNSIEIPSSIVNIGEYAFYGSGLWKIIIPDTVVNIGSNAFGGYYLCLVEIGSGVQIADNAFFNQDHFRNAYTSGGAGTYVKQYRADNIWRKTQEITNVTGISLAKSEIRIPAGGMNWTYRVTATIQPFDATIGYIRWSSSDEAVVLVNGDGRMKGISAGTAVITASTVDGNYEASFTVTVYEPIVEGDFWFEAETGTIVHYTGTQDKVIIPETISGIPVQAIGQEAFCGNLHIASVTIPSSVERIEDGAFLYCWNLNVVDIGSSVQVADDAFIYYHYYFLETYTTGGAGTYARDDYWGWRKIDHLINVTGISLERDEMRIPAGGWYSIPNTIIQPSNASIKGVVFTSDNEAVVSVNGDRHMRGNSAGTAIITAKTVEGGFEATCTVTVYEPVFEGDFGIEPETGTIVLHTGRQSRLTIPEIISGIPVQAIGEGAFSDMYITYVSIPSDVRVEKNAFNCVNLYAIKFGSNVQLEDEAIGGDSLCDAYATGGAGTYARDGWRWNKIDNLIDVTGLSLDYDEIRIPVGEWRSFPATVQPSNATIKGIILMSNNDNVVSFSGDGRVKGISAGMAVVMARTLDGDFEATCTVKVYEPVIEGDIRFDSETGTIIQYTGVQDMVNIPATIGGEAVQVIGENAFSNNRNITSVTIPSSVERIEYGAFQYCDNLYVIDIGTGVQIGNNAVNNSNSFREAYTAGGTGKYVRQYDGSWNRVNQLISVTGISLDNNEMRISVGGEYRPNRINATIQPSDATIKGIIWTSSNASVVSMMNDYGYIRANSAGTAVITAKTADGGFEATCTVTVYEPVIEGDFGIEPETGTIVQYTGTQNKLSIPETIGGVTVQVIGGNVFSYNKNIVSLTIPSSVKIEENAFRWCNNLYVIEIGSGVQIANDAIGWNNYFREAYTAGGTSTYARQDNGRWNIINQVIDVTGITIENSEMRIPIGGDNWISIPATVQPTNATIKGITWTSSNEAIVRVNGDGRIQGASTGTAVITAKTADGGFETICTVTVYEPVIEVDFGIDPETGTIVQYTGTQNKLSIPETIGGVIVKVIGGNVFSNNRNITSVTIPSSVERIEYGAFRYCNNLNVVEIGSSVQIADDAINNNNSFREAYLAGGAGMYARDGWTWNKINQFINVTGITIENSEMRIPIGGDNWISIPATVQPTNATIKGITWTSSNEAIVRVNGDGRIQGVSAGTAVITAKTADCGFEATCTVTVYEPVKEEDFEINAETGTIVRYRGTEDKVIIPETIGGIPVQVIGEYAFYRNNYISSVTIPSNVRIEKFAFFNCNNLYVVEIGSGVHIAGDALYSSDSLHHAYIAGGAGMYARDGWIWNKIDQLISVTGITIEKDAMRIPVVRDNWISIPATVQPSNATIKSITWTSSDESVVVLSGDGRMKGLSEGTVVMTARTVDGGFEAACTVKLYEPVIEGDFGIDPETGTIVLYTGTQDKVVIPETIGEITVKVIGENAFSNNRNIASVTIPSSVERIEHGAFRFCNLYVMQIGSGVQIANDAINNNNSFREAYIAGGAGMYAREGWTWNKFDQLISVTGIIIEKNEMRIPAEGESWISVPATIQPLNATIKGVTWTSSNENVVRVNSDGRIKGISTGTAVITAKTVDGNYEAACTVTVYELIIEDDFVFDAETGTIVQYKGTQDKVIIPGVIGGIPVQVIGENAFSQNSYIIGVTIPSSVVKIEYGAFLSCNNLYVVEIGSGVEIEDDAFCYENYFRDIYVPAGAGIYERSGPIWNKINQVISVTGVSFNKESIRIHVGEKYSDLTVSIQPENASVKGITWTSSNNAVASLEEGPIKGNSAGTAVISARTADGGFEASCTVTVYNLVLEGDFAFDEETGTIVHYTGAEENVIIPSTIGGVPVQTIGKEAFYRNNHIASVTISPSVLRVDEYAFKDCNNLCNIEIGSGVQILDYAVNWGNSFRDAYTAGGAGIYARQDHGTWVKINQTISVTGIFFDKNEIHIPFGENEYYRVKATIQPLDATIRGIIYSSSNEAVASISETGNMKVNSAGTTVITARTTDGGFEAYCTVTVYELVVEGDFIFDPETGTITKYTGTQEKVTIPSTIGEITVQVIGEKAFYNNNHISSVTIHPSVQRIDEFAFSGCDNLYVVQIGSGVQIASSAIGYDNHFLDAYTVDGAGMYARQDNDTWNKIDQVISVTGVSFENNDMLITAGEFYDQLATIHPSDATNKGIIYTSSNDAVVSIHGLSIKSNFAGTAVITARTADGDFEASCSVTVYYKTVTEEDFIFNAETGTITGFKGAHTTVEIPETIGEVPVRVIGENAFYNNNCLISVTIPSSVERIEKNAFSFCNNLHIIEIGSDVQIGSNAMYNANYFRDAYTAGGAGKYTREKTLPWYKIEQVTSVTGISLEKDEMRIPVGGKYWFYSNPATILPSNATIRGIIWTTSNKAVVSLNPDAHIRGESVGTSIITAKTVDGSFEAFYTVTVYEPIFDGDFGFNAETGEIVQYRGTSDKITIPSTINGISVQVIGESAFAHNQNGTSLTIPSSVVRIEKNAFSFSKILNVVEIGSGVHIADNAFNNCNYFRDAYTAGGAGTYERIENTIAWRKVN
ncbi:MAG TPA: leucine-rich repeat protein [Clostridia bacterium]|mgnify:FL=1|nr:leucine-rich repeat protein [Clostridia bacterium]